MRWLLLFIVILALAVTFWQVTLVVTIVLLLFVTIKSLLKRRRNNKLKTKKEAVIPGLIAALDSDRLKLTTRIVATIRKHWDVLSGKFEDSLDEDDYGNIYLHTEIKKELDYFIDKVVIQELIEELKNCSNSELNKSVDSGISTRPSDSQDTLTAKKNISFILKDTLSVLKNIPNDYYGISFDDEDKVVAEKILSFIDRGTIDGDLLYTLSENELLKNEYQEKVVDIFMSDKVTEIQLLDKLKSTNPISASPLNILVYVLFFALYNDKKNSKLKHKLVKRADFIGNDPYKYEEYIKKILLDEGFEARRTRSSGDYGADVIANRNGRSYAIQCKLYNKTVGTKAVQEIVNGRVFYNTDYAIVVSDNSFTAAAKRLGRKTNVYLVHHKNLINKIVDLEKSFSAKNK